MLWAMVSIALILTSTPLAVPIGVKASWGILGLATMAVVGTRGLFKAFTHYTKIVTISEVV